MTEGSLVPVDKINRDQKTSLVPVVIFYQCQIRVETFDLGSKYNPRLIRKFYSRAYPPTGIKSVTMYFILSQASFSSSKASTLSSPHLLHSIPLSCTRSLSAPLDPLPQQLRSISLLPLPPSRPTGQVAGEAARPSQPSQERPSLVPGRRCEGSPGLPAVASRRRAGALAAGGLSGAGQGP